MKTMRRIIIDADADHPAGEIRATVENHLRSEYRHNMPCIYCEKSIDNGKTWEIEPYV